MLRKLYVNNFLSLQNFEFMPEHDSTLFIGKNGSGKSSIGSALMILRDIGRGETSVDALVRKEDFSFSHTDLPIRFEITAALAERSFKYEIVFESLKNLKTPRIKSESLHCDGSPYFERELGEIRFWYSKEKAPSQFHLDWHRIGLPQIGDPQRDTTLEDFKTWLSEITILSPLPQRITGESHGESPYLSPMGENFADYLRWLLSEHPEAYSKILAYMRLYMPDLDSFQNKTYSRDTRELKIIFDNGAGKLELDYARLSDGEKCLFIAGTMETAIHYLNSPLVFWDEPDSYVSLWDMEKMISSLRQNFQNNGKILVTSHNGNAIRCFSPECTYLLSRSSHLEPTRMANLQELVKNNADVVDIIEANMLG